MAWFELHQELWSHPKTKRLARLLNISRPQAVGHVVGLWIWALDYAQDGDLSTYERGDIADACDWDGDPDQLVQALLDCGRKDGPGFLVDDGGLQINDWQDYAGKTVTRRQQTADRVRRYRQRNTDDTPEAKAGNVDVTRYTSVSNDTTVHNSTLHDKTGDDDGREAALTDLQVLGLFNRPMLEQFNDLWPELSGRRDWVGKAVTIARDNNASSPAYALKVLANSIHTGHEPGYQPATNGTGKRGQPERVPDDYNGLKARYVPDKYADIIEH